MFLLCHRLFFCCHCALFPITNKHVFIGSGGWGGEESCRTLSEPGSAWLVQGTAGTPVTHDVFVPREHLGLGVAAKKRKLWLKEVGAKVCCAHPRMHLSVWEEAKLYCCSSPTYKPFSLLMMVSSFKTVYPVKLPKSQRCHIPALRVQQESLSFKADVPGSRCSIKDFIIAIRFMWIL